MKEKVTVLSFLLVLASVSLAGADSYDNCRAECRNTEKQCIDSITFFDQAAINESKAACVAQTKDCDKKCHDIDDMGPEAYQEKLRQQAEEAERKRQEQEVRDNGNIKVYNPDQGQSGSDGIKSYQEPDQSGGGIKTYQFDQ